MRNRIQILIVRIIAHQNNSPRELEDSFEIQSRSSWAAYGTWWQCVVSLHWCLLPGWQTGNTWKETGQGGGTCLSSVSCCCCPWLSLHGAQLEQIGATLELSPPLLGQLETTEGDGRGYTAKQRRDSYLLLGLKKISTAAAPAAWPTERRVRPNHCTSFPP